MFKKELPVEKKEKSWCPTQNGCFTAYEPEYKNENGEWKPINVVQLTPNQRRGIEFPLLNGGILQQIYLCGRAQAYALAWSYASDVEANTYRTVEVRVVEYDLEYSIKARKRECTANVEKS